MTRHHPLPFLQCPIEQSARARRGVLIHWGVYENWKFRLHRGRRSGQSGLRRVALSRRFPRATLNPASQLHARPNVITSRTRQSVPVDPVARKERRGGGGRGPPLNLFPIYSTGRGESSRKSHEGGGEGGHGSIMRSVTPLSTVANRVSSNASRVPTSRGYSYEREIPISLAPLDFSDQFFSFLFFFSVSSFL